MKNDFKRFLSLALVVVMVFALLPTIALAADPIKIEMESGTLEGNATVPADAGAACSGGAGVGNVGNGGSVSHTVEMEADYLATISIWYATYNARSLTVTVNGVDHVIASCPGTGDWWTVGATPVSVQVELKAGENTIVFGNADVAPNLDYFTITLDEKIERAVLAGESVEAAAGSEVKVPLTLSNVEAAITAVEDIAGVQLVVNYGEGLELTGFEASEAFADFDWGTASYDGNTGRVLGFSPLEEEGVALADEMTLGSLVFQTAADFEGAAVEIQVEVICDNTGVECTTEVVAEAFEITWNDDVVPPEPPVNPFDDVEEDDYCYESVLWAVENEITTGTEAGKFEPDASATRGQVVTFLWRAAGKPEPTITVNPFTDVESDDYCYTAILWAVEEGITKGTTATTFEPDATCTRGEVATFLYRYDGENPVDAENPFKDVEAKRFYYNAVLWAVENEITTGTEPGLFEPTANCTRGQIVTFLYRYMG